MNAKMNHHNTTTRKIHTLIARRDTLQELLITGDAGPLTSTAKKAIQRLNRQICDIMERIFSETRDHHNPEAL